MIAVPVSDGRCFRFRSRTLSGSLCAAFFLAATPAFSESASESPAEVKSNYPPRYYVHCPDAVQFCPPIRTAFQDASETVRVFRGGQVNQHPNGGYGMALMQVAGRPLYHTGADLGWFREGEPVFAVADGIVRVSEAGLRQRLANEGRKLPDGPMDYGNLIVIEHREPDGSLFSSLYGHLGNDRRVRIGDLVTAGQQIGTIGRKSPMINGGYEPHVHFGIRRGGDWQPGDTIFEVKSPEGREFVIWLDEAGEIRSRVTVEPKPEHLLRVNVNGTPAELLPEGDDFSIPSFVLHATAPKGSVGQNAGYAPALGNWRDPVAFLRERHADAAPAPALIPTELMDREDEPTRYVVGSEAPSWSVERWLRPDDTPALDVADFRGKVVCLFVVQPTCPGCRSHGLPALEEVASHFRDDERVAVVALQPVTGARSRGTLQKSPERLTSQIDPAVPVGLCHSVKGPPAIVNDYQIAATPWTVIIDPNGIVQFSNVTVRPEEIIRRIKEQLPTKAADASATTSRE